MTTYDAVEGVPSLADVDPGLPSENRIAMTNDPNSPLWREAADVEAEVFIGAGYVDDAATLAKEYEMYLPATTMVGVSRGDEIVGAIRFIHYDDNIGFKTINDVDKGLLKLDEDSLDMLGKIYENTVTEVATISTKKERRGLAGEGIQLMAEMYGAILAVADMHNAPYVLASFDQVYFRRFSRFFGEAVIPIGPAVDYMGSPTIPVIMDVHRVYDYLKETGKDDFVAILDRVGKEIVDESRAINPHSQ